MCEFPDTQLSGAAAGMRTQLIPSRCAPSAGSAAAAAEQPGTSPEAELRVCTSARLKDIEGCSFSSKTCLSIDRTIALFFFFFLLWKILCNISAARLLGKLA